jgi:hypothetical protein
MCKFTSFQNSNCTVNVFYTTSSYCGTQLVDRPLALPAAAQWLLMTSGYGMEHRGLILMWWRDFALLLHPVQPWGPQIHSPIPLYAVCDGCCGMRCCVWPNVMEEQHSFQKVFLSERPSEGKLADFLVFQYSGWSSLLSPYIRFFLC